jgi:hypothetical protein
VDNKTAFVIAATCLYSTGHWIGGTVLLLGMAFNCIWQPYLLGIKRVRARFS